MKIVTSGEEFWAALDPVVGLIRSNFVVGQSMILEASDGRLAIYGQGNSTFAEATLPCYVEKEGVVALSVTGIGDVFRFWQGNLTVEVKKGKVHCSGMTEVELNVSDRGPDQIERMSPDGENWLPVSDLAKILYPAQETKEVNMKGIFVGRGRLLATDRYILASMSMPDVPDISDGCIDLDLALRLRGEGWLQISPERTWARIEPLIKSAPESSLLFCRPNVQSSFWRGAQAMADRAENGDLLAWFEADKGMLLRILRILTAVSKTRETENTGRAILKSDGQSVFLVAVGNELGTGHASLHARSGQGEMDIPLTPDHLARAIDIADAQDRQDEEDSGEIIRVELRQAREIQYLTVRDEQTFHEIPQVFDWRKKGGDDAANAEPETAEPEPAPVDDGES